jgi:UDP-N-acetylmuramoyl-tripeptide--D-alanyl-D-alanine ligase
MEISELYQVYQKYPHIVTDSRQVRENTIFFSLRGERFDGNRFAAEALKKGSRYAVVDDPEIADNEQFILVSNCLEALQELATYHRRQLDIPIIAITGSNGKTTTKELMAEILSAQYIVKATAGNLNNHIGVPLTLLGMDSTTELGIVEMGANHVGEIAFLCELTQPDYGLVTNVGKAHLEGFGSLEGVKQAKGELYRYLGEHGGLTFSDAGNVMLQEMISGIDTGVDYYGESEDAICSGEIISSDPFLSVRLSFRDADDMEISTGLVGSYNLENILAAVAVGLHFRIRPHNIQAALQGWSGNNMRSERLETDSNILIMDAYNANPTSMMAALENFRQQKHNRKILILGDMLELGDTATDSHTEILGYIPGMDCEEVFLVGPIFSGLQVTGDIKTFDVVDELANWLDQHPLRDSLILLKASRGIGLERLKDKL